jgi:hypothetical protein
MAGGKRWLIARCGPCKEQAFHSECKIPKAGFEMARPQAVARRKVRVWGMARIRFPVDIFLFSGSFSPWAESFFNLPIERKKS